MTLSKCPRGMARSGSGNRRPRRGLRRYETKMADVGFDGLAGADEDLRTAWRARLEREGKLNPGDGSVRDLVLGPAEVR